MTTQPNQSTTTTTATTGADATDRPPDSVARWAGWLLIATAAATFVAVAGRVAVGADQPTLAESMTAISENGMTYAFGGLGRLISGATLIAAAWFLLRTWIIRERLGTPAVPILLAVSGAFTLVSGACALALAASAPDAGTTQQMISDVRWISGKIGFAVAGLALIVAAVYQWRAGGGLRRIAPFSAIVGALMQFIWIDAATFMHPINGTAFFVWLLLVGAMLATGRVERRFAAMSADEPR